MKFKIVNGKVFDPSQKFNGVGKDIFVENGKIVNPNKSDFFTNLIYLMMWME